MVKILLSIILLFSGIFFAQEEDSCDQEFALSQAKHLRIYTADSLRQQLLKKSLSNKAKKLLTTPAKRNQKIRASDGAGGDQFGFSVAISGDQAIVGAIYDDNNVGNSGSAYIFSRNDDGTWTQKAKLLASDGAANDWFGLSVDISGDQVVVGTAYTNDYGLSSGSAYIFSKNDDGTWSQKAKLLPSDGATADYFGISVSISGNQVVVGACYDDDNGADSGSGYIFSKNDDSTWTQKAKLLASDGAADDWFGINVAISGDQVILGAPKDGDNGADSGSAYIFSKNDNGTWTQKAKLLASDGTANDVFSNIVAISGDQAIVGAKFDDDNGSNSGSAYIFSKNDDGTWTQKTKLLASDGAANDQFGFNVAISGNQAIVGAYFDDANGSDSGSAYIFSKNDDGTWTQKTKLLASDGASSDHFGGSVAISGNQAIVGAYDDDDNGSNSGSAYLFPAKLDVDINAVTGGTTDKTGNNQVYNGNSISVTASASPDYHFTSWSGDASGSANPLTINNITSDLSITPVFTRDTGNLVINLSADGSGASYTISGPSDFNSGQPLANQTGNFDQQVPTGNYSVTFTQPVSHTVNITTTGGFTRAANVASGAISLGSAATVTASYTRKQYTLTVNDVANGNTDRDGNNTVLHGSSLTITATANDGYCFVRWSGDTSGSANPLTINNIISNMSITPVFQEPYGNLQVSITGVNNGGWRFVREQAWRAPGLFKDLPVGDHTLEFKQLDGYLTPANQIVRIKPLETTQVTANYLEIQQKPKVHYFTATPAAVVETGSSTLSWQTSNSDYVKITPGSKDNLPTTGTLNLDVNETTIFTLTAHNRDKNISTSATVTVLPKTEIIYFKSSLGENPLYPGNKATLSWFVRGGQKLSLLNKTTGKTTELQQLEGSLEVAPDASTSYILKAQRGKEEQQAKLNVKVSEEVHINSFGANCARVVKGNKVKLSWSVQGSEKVEMTPEIGLVKASGSAELVIKKDTVFTLKADQAEKTLPITAVDQAPDLKLEFLAIRDRQGKEINQPIRGQKTSIQLKISNLGTDSCPDAQLTLDNGDRTVCTTSVETLKAGSSAIVTLHWYPREKGKNDLLLTIDPADCISELEEGNNSEVKSIRVKGNNGVDLLMDNIRLEVAQDGKSARLTYSLVNTGTKASPGFQYQLFLTKGARQGTNKAIAGAINSHVKALAAGQVKTFSRVIKLQKNTKKIHVHSLVDVHKAVKESNELNNETLIRIK